MIEKMFDFALVGLTVGLFVGIVAGLYFAADLSESNYGMVCLGMLLGMLLSAFWSMIALHQSNRRLAKYTSGREWPK